MTLLIAFSLNTATAIQPPWSYDTGPNLQAKDEFERKMARELVDLTATIANAPKISSEVVGKQRFRPAYGPIPWRMLLKPNSVKILFIGQDGTHIAEAANRPATAGFGGRAQDLAKYFGVNEGAAFINNYAFTINGQYNTANSPYIDKSSGVNKVFTTTLTDNKFWLASQDLESPVTQWRNDMIEWIIRNNMDSLKLIVAFGGAARDGISSFVLSRGGNAKGRLANKFDKLRVPELKIVSAGSNKQFGVVLNREGKDLYQIIENDRAQSEGRDALRYDYKDAAHQDLVTKDLRNNLSAYIESEDEEKQLLFTRGGEKKSGILEAAQLGGFDMEKLSPTRDGTGSAALMGLRLNTPHAVTGEELVIQRVLVVQLPHPTALSMMTPDDASETVKARLEILQPYKAAGWKIEADWEVEPTPGVPGSGKKFKNNFDEDQPYRYARSDIGPEYYDFGTPASRMVSVSSASRMSGAGNSHIIVFGSRERGNFSRTKLDQMTNAKAANEEALDLENNLLTTRPRSEKLRDVFDPGPNVLDAEGNVAIKYAEIMKTNLDFKEIYRMKDGTEWDKDNRSHQNKPIENFNIKTHPMIADFGHYRGTFNNPKVIVLADPDGYDDMVTSRALTGERGQYLQGMLNDLAVTDDYLVIKTVPFGMDGATEEEWAAVLEKTDKYRKAIFAKLLSQSKPLMVITDGAQAKKVVSSLLENTNIPVQSIERSTSSKKAGILAAGNAIINSQVAALDIFNGKNISEARANIPRKHLTFYARMWEGTSGDSVLASEGALAGIAFAEVAPKWSWKEEFKLSDEEKPQVKKLIAKLEDNKLPGPFEKVKDFVTRMLAEVAGYSPTLD